MAKSRESKGNPKFARIDRLAVHFPRDDIARGHAQLLQQAVFEGVGRVVDGEADLGDFDQGAPLWTL